MITNTVQGLVLYNLFVALALIFNQYANPIAVTAIKWKCEFPIHLSSIESGSHFLDYIVYDVWLLVEVIVVYFLFIETSGASLEEVSLLFDGKDAKDRLVEEVARATDHTILDGESIREKGVRQNISFEPKA